MTDREIDAAVHRAVYPRHNINEEGEYCEGDHERSGSCQWWALPNYSTDLNAIDAAVRSWATTPERRNAFVVALVKIVHGELGDFGATFVLMMADAKSRCLALLAAAKERQ